MIIMYDLKKVSSQKKIMLMIPQAIYLYLLFSHGLFLINMGAQLSSQPKNLLSLKKAYYKINAFCKFDDFLWTPLSQLESQSSSTPEQSCSTLRISSPISRHSQLCLSLSRIRDEAVFLIFIKLEMVSESSSCFLIVSRF